ncbi:MAG TPA: hypothetical protein VGK67_03900 [Myxococcales bacterium]
MRRCLPMLVVAALGTASCGSSGGVSARFDPTLAPHPGDLPGSWLGFPFPSDHRRAGDGRAKLSDFPNPGQGSLLQSYIAVGEANLDGFSTNGAVYVAFDGALDVSTLPAGLSADGPLQLVDVTDGSPEKGLRRPVRWEHRAQKGRFLAANTLAVAPAAGFPMRERTTYALLIDDRVKGKDGKPLRQPALLTALLAGDSAAPQVQPSVPADLYRSLSTLYQPVRDLLAAEGTASGRIAVAVVFTTQSVTAQLAAIHDQIDSAPAPVLRADAWQTPRGATSGAAAASYQFEWKPGEVVDYRLLEGRFTGQNYQEGQLPYLSSGGALHFEAGAPKAVREEDLRFVLTVPAEPPRSGSCYRLVEVAHGTGGDAYSFHGDGTAGRLAARGLAAISLDQPLHGLRAEGQVFDVNMVSFNYFNPDSARSVFRQSAADTFQLTKFARESLKVPAAKSPTGQDLCFEPEKIGFFGHSHGGITGAIAAAHERRVGAWMLSGAGGVLSRTLVERKDPMDIQAMVSFLLSLPADEPLSELHPVATLIQTITDVTDPVNYAPYWAARADFGAPSSVMLTSGMHDVYTPPSTTAAMAVAARVPILAPVVESWPEYAASAMAVAATAPVEANLAGGATGGFLQWTDDLAGDDVDTHFVVFHRPEAIHASMRFLESAAFETQVSIERDPASQDR